MRPPERKGCPQNAGCRRIIDGPVLASRKLPPTRSTLGAVLVPVDTERANVTLGRGLICSRLLLVRRGDQVVEAEGDAAVARLAPFLNKLRKFVLK